MKRLTQVALISAALHLVYFIATFGIGFIRTLTYEPDIILQDNVVVLQDAVVIGTTWPPLLFVLTFIGLTAFIAVGLQFVAYKRDHTFD
ncbi:hypothetical protein [Exiguobacterium alkaliphilum]|uniref:hypothetical protein n=1 Tax=Exiguobacterium alkaliphilum TaxID=1428684 RepID=UPI00403ADA2B